MRIQITLAERVPFHEGDRIVIHSGVMPKHGWRIVEQLSGYSFEAAWSPLSWAWDWILKVWSWL